MHGSSQLEGVRHPRPLTDLVDKPELRFHGVQSPYAWFPIILESSLTFLNSGLSDLFVTCQLIADNKPLTIPFRTSYKAFKNNYTSASNYSHRFRSVNSSYIGGMSGFRYRFATAISL